MFRVHLVLVLVCVEFVFLTTGKIAQRGPVQPEKCGILECQNEGICTTSGKCECQHSKIIGDDCSVIDEGADCSGGKAVFTMTLSPGTSYKNSIVVTGSNQTHPCLPRWQVDVDEGDMHYFVEVNLADVTKAKRVGCAAHVIKDIRTYKMQFTLLHDEDPSNQQIELQCTQPLGS